MAEFFVLSITDSVSAKLPCKIIYRVKYRRFDVPSNLRSPATGSFHPPTPRRSHGKVILVTEKSTALQRETHTEVRRPQPPLVSGTPRARGLWQQRSEGLSSVAGMQQHISSINRLFCVAPFLFPSLKPSLVFVCFCLSPLSPSRTFFSRMVLWRPYRLTLA